MSRQLLCTSHRTFVREKFTKNTKKIFSPELWTHNQQETTFSYLTSAHAKHVRLNVNKQQNNCSIFKVEWIIAHQLSLHGLVHCEVRWLCIEGLREFPIEFVRLIKLLNLLNIFFAIYTTVAFYENNFDYYKSLIVCASQQKTDVLSVFHCRYDWLFFSVLLLQEHQTEITSIKNTLTIARWTRSV